MDSLSPELLGWIALQVLLVLGLAPLLNGSIKTLKALLQGRCGPSVFQGYFDLYKYFQKETVISQQASWITLNAPLVLFSATLVASLIIPTFFITSTDLLPGGIILWVSLQGLGRFAMVLAAMETAGSFCGMAAGRELLLSCLIEPVSLLALFVMAFMAGSTHFSNMLLHLANQPAVLYSPPYLLCMVALLIASLAELGRIPFDNPETHYELTMIHEGMLLDYSGPLLGVMLWSHWIKHLVVLSLLGNLFFPWQLFHGQQNAFNWPFLLLAFGIYLLKLGTVATIIALIETLASKVRLFRVTEILGVSFVLAFVGLLLTAKQNIAGFGL